MKTIKALFVALVLLGSTNAYGVSSNATVTDSADMDHVTTSMAERAEADVQIRRIKSLLLTQEVDGDAAFEELEKLQKSLRGQK